MRQNVIIEAVPEDLVHKLTKEKTGDSMQVGLNIKIKRIGRGYTQEEIADAIGVARSTYTRYESDKRLPDIYKLCALADYFDVSLDYLLARTDNPQGKLYEHRPKIAPGNEEMKQFIEMCFDPQSPLNEKLKQTLLEMMEVERK